MARTTVEGISIEFVVPDDVPLLYSDQTLVTTTDNESVVFFFQTQPPAVPGPARTVQSRCVARIVLTHRKAKELALALEQALKRDDAKRGEPGKEG